MASTRATIPDHWQHEASYKMVTAKSYYVLRTLFPDNEMSLSDISEKTGINEGTVHRILERLESHGLTTTRQEKSRRGKPSRLTRISYKGAEEVRQGIEGARLQELKPVDPLELDYFMKLVDPNNKELQGMAAGELVALCEHSIVPDEILSFLEKRIFDPQYLDIRLSLLHALLNITRNSNPDRIRGKIRPRFSDPLANLLYESSDELREAERDLRLMVMQTLTSMSEGDEGFRDLTGVLTNLIKKKDPLVDRELGLVVSRYPDWKSELRRRLFRLMTSTDAEVVRKTKELIVALREAPSG